MLLSRSIVPEAEALIWASPKVEVVLSSAVPLSLYVAAVASCFTRSMRMSLLARPTAEIKSLLAPLDTVFTAWSKKLLDIRLLADR